MDANVIVEKIFEDNYQNRILEAELEKILNH